MHTHNYISLSVLGTGEDRVQMLPLKQQTVTFYCNLLQGTAECMHAMFKSQIKVQGSKLCLSSESTKLHIS